MKHCKIFLYSLIFILGIHACVEDKGSLDYHPINEVQIGGFGDSVYNVLYLADVLNISPRLQGSLDAEFSDDNYEYQWLLRGEADDSSWGTVLGTERELDYPVDFKPGNYALYFKVRDRKSGVLFTSKSEVVVATTLTRGLLVLGDDVDGNVHLDMISMLPGRDTVVLHDLLKDSGLPPMKGAVSVCHTGANTMREERIKLWIMGEEESYFVNGVDMTASVTNTVEQLLYSFLPLPANVHPVNVFPRVNDIGGRQVGQARGMQLSDGSIVITPNLMMWEESYGTPNNRLADAPDELLPMAPYVFYPLGSSSWSYMGYDTKNEQFLYAYNTATVMKQGVEKDTDPFPWRQSSLKRTLVYGENTRNTYGGSSKGASFALMKDDNGDYYIYVFYLDTSVPAKLGVWHINKEIAADFDQATRYMFSSSRTLMYYVVDNAVHCYDYSTGSERHKVVIQGIDEITYLQADLQTGSSPFNHIWVGTYNSNMGGTLTKYKESTDPNKLELVPVNRSCWSNLSKIKSVEWRNSQK